jgi:hypothetical protein
MQDSSFDALPPSPQPLRTSYEQSGARFHHEGQDPTMVGVLRSVALPS